MTGGATDHRAFGLALRSHLALPELPAVVDRPRIDFTVTTAAASDIDTDFSGPNEPRRRSAGVSHGTTTFTTERGRAGDYLVELDEPAARFLICRDRRAIRIATRDVSDPVFRRFLCDTVFGTAALAAGFEMLHAASVRRPEGVVALAAGQGGGKSTQLIELLRRGASFFGDDLLALGVDAAGVAVAHAAPPLMNVPADRFADVSSFGTVLAHIGDESWVVVGAEHTAVEPAPVAAVVLLERGGSAELEVERLPETPAPLLPHVVSSGHAPERRRRRFELLEALARRPLFRVAAPDSSPPGAIADALVERVAPS